MLHLTLEFSSFESLSKVQREALADFILAFPASEVVPPPPSEESEDENETAGEQDARIQQAFGPTGQETAAAEVFFSVGSGETVVIPPPPAVNEYGNGLDKNGLPWDERIHASSRAKVADGTWRQKRGVDAGLVAQIEAELKALMSIPSPATGALNDNGPLPVNLINVPAPPVEARPYVIPPPPALTVVPQAKHCDVHDKWHLDVCLSCLASVTPTPPPPPTIDFMGLLMFASTAIQSKKLTLDQVNTTVQDAGVPSLPLLQNRPDLLPGIHASLTALMEAR